MANSFLNNQALEDFIGKTRLARVDKDFLLSKLPQLDEEGRRTLFHFLKEIYFIDRQEREALENLWQCWKNN